MLNKRVLKDMVGWLPHIIVAAVLLYFNTKLFLGFLFIEMLFQHLGCLHQRECGSIVTHTIYEIRFFAIMKKLGITQDDLKQSAEETYKRQGIVGEKLKYFEETVAIWLKE
jgi:hypothetical protein